MEPLALPSPEQLEKELDLNNAAPEPEQISDEALRFVESLFTQPLQVQRSQIDQLGLNVQAESARQANLLNTPMEQLAGQSNDASEVARALNDLRSIMQQLKPDHQALEAKGISGLLSRLPGVATPVQRYFKRFETAQDTLNRLIKGLEAGRDRLSRDNVTLSHDQQDMRTSLEALQHHAALGVKIDEALQSHLARKDGSTESTVFIEEELIFPLRQRIMDLQQQQAVCQQGILAVEVIIRNNRELIRGVDRALNVTMSALRVAVTVALALANQKLVLNHIDALNDTTNEMIAGTAQALRQQGVDIQTRAATAQLDMQVLEQSFEDMLGALDDLSSYRQKALPAMTEQIKRMQELTRRGQASIDTLASGEPSRS